VTPLEFTLPRASLGTAFGLPRTLKRGCETHLRTQVTDNVSVAQNPSFHPDEPGGGGLLSSGVVVQNPPLHPDEPGGGARCVSHP
jgi:hypothetical protein